MGVAIQALIMLPPGFCWSIHGTQLLSCGGRLLNVDGYIHIMSSITSTRIIEKLSEVFAIHGLPQKVVTDNGTSFTTRSEFQEFMSSCGIKHITSALPSLPVMASLSEQCSLSIQGLKKTSGKNIQDCLTQYVSLQISNYSSLHYRIAPAELLMGRHLRSRLDLLYRELSDRVERE